ncbi:MAG: ribosome maturation factor RimM [Dermatophilaceae bacterium]|nr:ribosome maturation factor RimM [Dermatophilaceae bacterium]MBP9918269.1 ribosome maturation factor RimM [Dermatophilaceae bacterium]
MSHVVARIGRPHGIKGEVTVQLHTDNPAERFAVGTVLPTRAPKGSGVPLTLTIAGARDHNGIWLLAFEEIPDRTGAEGLRGTRLLTPIGEEELLEPDGGGDVWYEEQLVGLRAERPDGSFVGTVAALHIGPGQDRLALTLEGGRTAYIPFVSALVPTVDIRGGRIVVDPPPGLLDLDA